MLYDSKMSSYVTIALRDITNVCAKVWETIAKRNVLNSIDPCSNLRQTAYYFESKKNKQTVLTTVT